MTMAISSAITINCSFSDFIDEIRYAILMLVACVAFEMLTFRDAASIVLRVSH